MYSTTRPVGENETSRIPTREPVDYLLSRAATSYTQRQESGRPRPQHVPPPSLAVYLSFRCRIRAAHTQNYGLSIGHIRCMASTCHVHGKGRQKPTRTTVSHHKAALVSMTYLLCLSHTGSREMGQRKQMRLLHTYNARELCTRRQRLSSRGRSA